MLSIKTHDQLYPQLFERIQLSGLLKDSKQFVDAIPVIAPIEIIERYRVESQWPEFNLATFVERHFIQPEVAGASYQECSTRSVREHIDDLWKVLSRPADVESQFSSLIPLPNPYLVPGGRFREIYYWDSYFTMLGLFESGKIEVVRAMLDNFAHLIDRLGFIPNGNRSYFCTRSQPPVFALMVELLANHDGEESVYLKYLPQLEKEYSFWMRGYEELSFEKPCSQRVVKVNGGHLNRYWDNSDLPRPESYKEDIELAQKTSRASAELYRDIRAACESGWDFTSRWFKREDDFTSIETTNILPVDLNSLIYKLECVLSKAYGLSSNQEASKSLARAARSRKDLIQQYFFDRSSGIFVDLRIDDLKSTGVNSLATAFPLFLNIASKAQGQSVAKALNNKFLKAGGWITTLSSTHQQWDSPNGWAPLQWVCYQGLKNYQQNELASEGALRWVNNNLGVYQSTAKLVEKYNVVDLGALAGGGEYEVQHGFGWTNGVLLKFMNELDL